MHYFIDPPAPTHRSRIHTTQQVALEGAFGTPNTSLSLSTTPPSVVQSFPAEELMRDGRVFAVEACCQYVHMALRILICIDNASLLGW